MSPSDFDQFDDPRVREVMAAAANLVEHWDSEREHFQRGEGGCGAMDLRADTLKTALFAAQHSKPRSIDRVANHGATKDGRITVLHVHPDVRVVVSHEVPSGKSYGFTYEEMT